jgi:hypothetical protein
MIVAKEMNVSVRCRLFFAKLTSVKIRLSL